MQGPGRKIALSDHARRSLIASAVALAAVVAIFAVRNLTVDGPLDHLRHTGDLPGGVRVYEGSWFFPRGGPYMVGFESPGPGARLWIDGIEIRPRGGRPVVREPWRGPVRADAPRSGRLAYDPGVVGVRFEAPPGARLLWIPPGRRSDPEYVPPRSLSPEPPAKARFGSWAGARPLDGIFALLLLFVGAGWAVYLARGPLRRALAGDGQRVWLVAAAVLVLALGVRLYDLGGHGQTWDENTNWSAGRNYVTNVLSLDFSQSSWRWNYEHPPVMKYVAGLGAQFADGYGPARGLSALMMAIACALLVPIGRRLWSLRVGLLAGVIAALTPHLVAHGQIVGHEAPTALWWSLAVLLCLGAYDDLDLSTRADRRRLMLRFAGIGLVLGLAVFSRFANGLVAPLMGLLLLYNAPAGHRGRVVAYGFIILPLVALAVGFAVWPRLWSAPIHHLAESWDKLKKPHTPEWFLGVMTNTPPRTYFAVYLWATAPVGVLLGAIAWLARTAWKRERAAVVVALWLLVPLAVALSPVRQDGVRYIIPSLLALALAAAAGFDWLFDFVAARLGERVRWVGGALVAAYLAVSLVLIHPYYLDYYGEQVGGPERVWQMRNFEIAWWGEGLESAIDYVNREAPRGARVDKHCISPYDHLGWLRGDLWRTLAPNASSADWMIVYQPAYRDGRASCRAPSAFSLVYETSARGAAVARVYRRADSAGSPPR